MSVIDYKYVNSVNVEQACSESVNLADEIDVRNLKLLVWDERLEDEANWVNAVLAGQLWPQPVLDFYLDHLVLEGGDRDEDEDEEGSVDWLQQIFEGLDLLDRGYKVKDILGTLNLNVDEWRVEMKKLALKVDVLETATALAVEADNFEIATDLESANEQIKQLELEADDLKITTEEREELKEIERDFETKTDVLDIAIALENADLGSSRKPGCQGNIKTRQDVDTESGSDQQDDDDDEEESEGEGVLLFKVGLALEADDDNVEVVLLHLEDLKDLAPELLTKFLQSKLRFIDEDSVDD